MSSRIETIMIFIIHTSSITTLVTLHVNRYALLQATFSIFTGVPRSVRYLSAVASSDTPDVCGGTKAICTPISCATTIIHYSKSTADISPR